MWNCIYVLLSLAILIGANGLLLGATNSEPAKETERIRLSDFHAPRWSPDGKRIAFAGRVQREGVSPLRQDSEGWGIWTVKPDGTDLSKVVVSWKRGRPGAAKPATQQTGEYDLPGGYRLPAPPPQPIGPVLGGPSDFVWSPDSREILFADWIGECYGEDEVYLWLVSSDGTNLRVFTKMTIKSSIDRPYICPIAWLASGKIVAHSSSGLVSCEIKNPRLFPATLQGLPRFYGNPCFSNDGQKIVCIANMSDSDSNICIYDAITRNLTNLTKIRKGAGVCASPSLSSDGKKIVFTFEPRLMTSDLPRGSRIWLINVNGGTSHPLTVKTEQEEDAEFLQWVGKSTLSDSAKEEAKARWGRKTLDGSQRSITITDEEPCFSTDGTQIVFIRSYGGIDWSKSLWIMNSDGSRAQAITFSNVDVTKDNEKQPSPTERQTTPGA